MFAVPDTKFIHIAFGIWVENSAIGGMLAGGSKITHAPVAAWPFRDLKCRFRRSI